MQTEEFTFKVAGTPYNGRQELLRSLFVEHGENMKAELSPEKDNPHDKFAVGVWSFGKKIGYVPRDFSQDISECMDCLISSKMNIFNENDLLCAKITAVYGEE